MGEWSKGFYAGAFIGGLLAAIGMGNLAEQEGLMKWLSLIPFSAWIGLMAIAWVNAIGMPEAKE